MKPPLRHRLLGHPLSLALYRRIGRPPITVRGPGDITTTMEGYGQEAVIVRTTWSVKPKEPDARL